MFILFVGLISGEPGREGKRNFREAKCRDLFLPSFHSPSYIKNTSFLLGSALPTHLPLHPFFIRLSITLHIVVHETSAGVAPKNRAACGCSEGTDYFGIASRLRQECPLPLCPPLIWGHYFDSRVEILTFTYPSQKHALQKLTLSSQKVIIHPPHLHHPELLPAVGRRSVHLARPGPCQTIVVPPKWDLNVLRFNGFSNICKLLILQVGR